MTTNKQPSGNKDTETD